MNGSQMSLFSLTFTVGQAKEAILLTYHSRNGGGGDSDEARDKQNWVKRVGIRIKFYGHFL